MRHARRVEILSWAVFTALTWSACGGDDAPGEASGGSGGAGASAAGSGAGTGASGSTAAGTGAGTGNSGASGTSGAAGAGAGNNGAAGEDMDSAGAGDAGAAGCRGGRRRGCGGSAGNTAAGSGATAGTSGGAAGMTSPAAGSGGVAPGCVENLACKLDALATTGDSHQDCVDRINQFRTRCACLPALARWTEAESCANQMSEYDSQTGMSAHAGFGAGICDPGGSAQNECPGWRSEEQIVSGCLQSMWDEGPPPTTDCSGDCFQTYGHFINMSNTRYTKVACGFFTRTDGKIWSVQNFSR